MCSGVWITWTSGRWEICATRLRPSGGARLGEKHRNNNGKNRLDVSQHMSLCRHYVRELRRSVLIGTPELEKGGGSKRSSQILDNFERNSADQGPSGHRHRQSESGLSAFLRNETASKHSPKNSQHSNRSETSEAPPRPSYMTENGNSPNTPSPQINSNSSPEHTVARADIHASAEKILYTYLLPGAEREIILPQGILNDITNNIEKEGRDDPEVFDAAKDYVFQAMERDAFPGFLRAKALGNIVAPSMMLRLITGLIALFGALWTAFVLIFLNASRSTRCWEILPFTVGVYLLATHQYMLDPLMALAGYSEYTFMSFSRVKEPFVRYVQGYDPTECNRHSRILQKTPEQARADVPGVDRSCRCSALLPLHLCAW